jgi:flagellar protein FliO/FliZ
MTATDLPLAVLALLGVVGLILLARRAALLLPRLPGATARAGPLRLEQTLALDTRRRLLLVRCGPRTVLLLTGGGQDVVVGWLDTPTENPEPPP